MATRTTFNHFYASSKYEPSWFHHQVLSDTQLWRHELLLTILIFGLRPILVQPLRSFGYPPTATRTTFNHFYASSKYEPSRFHHQVPSDTQLWRHELLSTIFILVLRPILVLPLSSFGYPQTATRTTFYHFYLSSNIEIFRMTCYGETNYS